MNAPTLFLDGKVSLYGGDCRDVLRSLADNSVDSVVTDPPYALVSIVKRFGKTALGDATDTADRSRKGADGYARLAKGFMGKAWDNGEAAFAVEFWADVLRVLKPGGHVAAFSGTRTYHRLACAIEDAGFEIRDSLQWLYGSGFPKSHDVSKGIDKAMGVERGKVLVPAGQVRNPKATGGGKDGLDGATRPFIVKAAQAGFHEAVSDEAVSDEAVSYQGWGTALKPAVEPICLARKPLSEKTVAANVLKWGVGALNINASRIPFVGMNDAAAAAAAAAAAVGFSASRARGTAVQSNSIGKESRGGENTYDPFALAGRWPANVLIDGSPEVLAGFPESAGAQGVVSGNEPSGAGGGVSMGLMGRVASAPPRGDSGSAARFFYSAKADDDDRIGSKHPTVKPVNLMQWLVRLITPKGGVTLDPFAGTGTTGEAAWREGFRAILIERESEYQADIARRMEYALAGPDARRQAIIKATGKVDDAGPLFSEGIAK